MTRAELAELAARLLEENGGFTLDSNGDTPARGFAVSIFPDAGEVIENPSLADIARYIAKVATTLAEDARVHLGGWVNAGKTYLDLSLVLDTAEEALDLAFHHEQWAVFDLETFEEWAVEGCEG